MNHIATTEQLVYWLTWTHSASVEKTGQSDYMYQWCVCVCVCVYVCVYVLYIVDYPHLHTASLITPGTTTAGKQADFST
jgi:hypothetical protein